VITRRPMRVRGCLGDPAHEVAQGAHCSAPLSRRSTVQKRCVVGSAAPSAQQCSRVSGFASIIEGQLYESVLSFTMRSDGYEIFSLCMRRWKTITTRAPTLNRRATRWCRSSPRGASAPRLARRCARSSRSGAAPRDRGALPRRWIVPALLAPPSRGHRAGSCRRRRHRRAPGGCKRPALAALPTQDLAGATLGYIPRGGRLAGSWRRPSSRNGGMEGCPPRFCLERGGSWV